MRLVILDDLDNVHDVINDLEMAITADDGTIEYNVRRVARNIEKARKRAVVRFSVPINATEV